MLYGIDEAGRGAVVGPLIIGIVRWEYFEPLDKSKLKDSKKLSKAKIEKVASDIKSEVSSYALAIPPFCIDYYENLTVLQIEVMSKFFDNKDSGMIIMDKITNNNETARFLDNEIPHFKIRSEKKADEKFKPVSAASIIAKSAREKAVNNLHDKYGNFGSGYPSDTRTRTWLETYYKNHLEWPPCVRQSWSTISDIEQEQQQLF